MLLNSYVLSVVEENEVPLSSGIGQEQFFTFAIVVMIAIALLLCVGVYLSMCLRIRNRMTSLLLNGSTQQGRKVKGGWNLFKLRRELEAMETDVLGNMQSVG